MIVNYSDQEVIKSEKSIFLAGPTPRKIEIESYRKEAIKILKKLGFDGVVYVPEHENNEEGFDYTNQIEWETEALNAAGVIVFWIPRQLPDMPAFTTNVEFGEWYKHDKTIYGRPDNSCKNRYLDKKYFMQTNRLPFSNLENLLKYSVDKLNGKVELDIGNSNAIEIVKSVLNTYLESCYLVGETNFTPESYNNFDGNRTYGKILFPNKSNEELKEFDRTMLSIVLYYYLKYNYHVGFFICHQNKESNLTSDDFNKLREFVFSVINTREKEYLILYYIIINGIEKIKFVNKVIKEMGFDSSIDLRDCLKLLPTYKTLNDSDKKLLKNVVDYGINVGQFIQGECVPFSLKSMKNLNENEIGLMIVEAILDIAGVYGYIIQDGSVSLDHFTYSNIELAIKKIVNCDKIEKAYINYIDEKATQYNLTGDNFENRAITRICLMLKINNSQDANIVKEELVGYQAEHQEEYQNVMWELNVNGFYQKAILLYYSSDLLCNTLGYFKNLNVFNPLKQSLKICLPFLQRVFKYVRQRYNEEDAGVITVMLKEAAIIAATSPENLKEFDLDTLEIQL